MTIYFSDKWEYSADDHEANWRKWTAGTKVGDILEVGSFEGRSCSVWKRIHPEARIVCVDPFGGTEHGEGYGTRFDSNTRHLGGVTKVRGRSETVLPTLTGPYDVVYIDGDHTARAVEVDSFYAWPLLAIGGVLIWDDYEWTHGGMFAGRPEMTPRPAINAFLEGHAGQYEELGRGWQVAIRKVAP